jgi:16S rRNA (uracil1498-N3)-methyltransferase
VSVRAFVPGDRTGPIGTGELVELDDEESRYLLKVRRLRRGDALELLDGSGHVWRASLSEAGRRASVRIDAVIERAVGPERILLLGLPDTPAILDALTCASELGATQVVMVGCERSPGHLPSHARIDRVLRAAMRQCGRPAPPHLHGVTTAWSLAAALAHAGELPGVLGDPEASALGWQPPCGGLRLLVGPEGGLTEPERDAALAAGFTQLQLGPWILRTPTAVAALLARAWPERPSRAS